MALGARDRLVQGRCPAQSRLESTPRRADCKPSALIITEPQHTELVVSVVPSVRLNWLRPQTDCERALNVAYHTR